MKREVLIRGGNLVLPDKVERGDVLVKDGLIRRVALQGEGLTGIERNASVIDASGIFLLPGIIDLHSDAIEKEIEPRPSTYFPISFSFYELEKKLACSGITTIYHSLSLVGETGHGVRSDKMILQIIDFINKSAMARPMIRHRVHLRYEVANLPGVATTRKLLEQRSIHLLSFMDHTPGQGQYATLGSYERYVMKTRGITLEEASLLANNLKEWRMKVDAGSLKALAAMAKQMKIAVASHDDDTPEKIDRMLSLEVAISEFPVNLETAAYASSKGIFVSMGAPNVVRGESHENNLRALDAIRYGVVDILCSDYCPPAMLSAVFKLAEEGIALHRAAAMVSLNPARALGLDNWTGSIAEGKHADLLLVELYRGHPFVRKTIVAGRVIYQSDFQEQGGENAC